MSAKPVVLIQLAGYEDTKKCRDSYIQTLECNPRLEQASPLASAGASWSTRWSLVDSSVGLTSTVAPASSNAKSSPSESDWETFITFWALPVLATPWTGAFWLELLPLPETSKDCSMSPLSASLRVWAQALAVRLRVCLRFVGGAAGGEEHSVVVFSDQAKASAR
jgi:hypothetical protein